MMTERLKGRNMKRKKEKEKITDYDEIGSLRIMTQRNGKLRIKNERFDWLLQRPVNMLTTL
jgi:hypothetical protein